MSLVLGKLKQLKKIVMKLTILRFGFYGEADVPTYCHAGGSSTDDFICAGVVDPLVITIGA